MITEPICFLELIGLGKSCEHRITESLTELFWEFYSVISVEEFPNRNCFGINLVIFLGAMVFLFCKLIFRDHPKRPFKTSIKLTFPRLVLPRKVIFALQGKRLKITRKDS